MTAIIAAVISKYTIVAMMIHLREYLNNKWRIICFHIDEIYLFFFLLCWWLSYTTSFLSVHILLDECCEWILLSVMSVELFSDSRTKFGDVEVGCGCFRLVCWLSAIFEVYIDKIMKKNYKSIELMEVTTYDLCLWCIFKWVVFLGRIFTSIADFDNLVFLDWCRC